MAVIKRIDLPVRRPFNQKLFWVLMGLNVPAAFALIPFAMNLQKAFADRGTEMVQGWEALLIDRIVTILLIALLAVFGLALANRIGVGLPFVEKRLMGEPLPRRFRGIVAVGLLVGIGCAVIILALDVGVFREPMTSMFQELDIEVPKEAVAPPLYGFLAAISAGVTEETVFRLFGLSLLGWLGGLLLHTKDGRPKPAVFWIANILFALAFGAAHLTTASAIGWPMNGLVLTRLFLLNGIGGLAFGWLFWTYGLESAMLAHFFTDVGLYTLLPIIALQIGKGGLPVAIAGVTVVVILGVSWAVWTLARERTYAESAVTVRDARQTNHEVGMGMKTKRLGNSDLQITSIGLGTWAIGGDVDFGWGPQDDAESIAAIHRAVERGTDWIDTAPVYGLGHSEEVVGQALSRLDRAKRPLVFTKCGLVWNEQRNIGHSLKSDAVRGDVEASLRRLQVDVLDLCQIHWPSPPPGREPSPEVEEGWATLAELKREGKIRHIGVSNFSVAQLKRALAIAPITSLQPPYSMLMRQVEEEILPFCQEHGIGVIGYSPLQNGLLSGRWTRERIAGLPESDWRKNHNPAFKEPHLTRNLEFVESLRALAERLGCSPAEVAIAWTLRHPAVTGTIVGARGPAQVDGFIGAMEFRLGEADIDEIAEALPPSLTLLDR